MPLPISDKIWAAFLVPGEGSYTVNLIQIRPGDMMMMAGLKRNVLTTSFDRQINVSFRRVFRRQPFPQLRRGTSARRC
jgi:hypothetical protein